MQAAYKQYRQLTASGHSVSVCYFDLVAYQDSYAAMVDFALNHDEESEDQIWVLQHFPVYTQGTACTQGTLSLSDIPVLKSDRGGQITYHGPGQIVMYPLLKLKRYDLGVKALVSKFEQSVIDLLTDYGVHSDRREGAPGVYVKQKKISALGLRIKHGTSYHGLSFNINMDLTPFNNIDPCGHQGLQVTQLSNLIETVDIKLVQDQLIQKFAALI